VQVTVPVPPTAEVVQDHPTGAVSDPKVVVAGTASDSVSELAPDGPALATTIAYVMLPPAVAGSGDRPR
jgi:hypothetical protein